MMQGTGDVLPDEPASPPEQIVWHQSHAVLRDWRNNLVQQIVERRRRKELLRHRCSTWYLLHNTGTTPLLVIAYRAPISTTNPCAPLRWHRVLSGRRSSAEKVLTFQRQREKTRGPSAIRHASLLTRNGSWGRGEEGPFLR